MAWYSYQIDKSQIVKNPTYKHYFWNNFNYSFNVKAVTNDPDNLTALGHYVTNGQVAYTGQFTPNQVHTFSGTAPLSAYDYVMYLYLEDTAHIDGYRWPVTFEDGYVNNYYRAYPPVVSKTYTGTKATPTGNTSFSGGFIDFSKNFKINFGINYISHIDEQYTISSGVFYYKLTSAGSYSSLSFNGSTLTIPANTLQTGQTYNAYAVLTLDDGTTCQVNLNNISTVDGTPSVVAVDPKNTIVYGETEFEWQYSNSAGTDQYAYDIQLSSDNGSTWTTILNHVVSSSTKSAVFSSISAGTYLWRVRAYNHDNVASSWSSSLQFICNVPPTPPTINSIDPGGRITVRWTSADQVAYRLIIETDAGSTVYDSGDIYSIDNKHFVNEYLVDGNYVLKLKIVNVFGISSEYATYNFTQNSQITAPVIRTSFDATTGTVTVEIVNYNLFSRYYLKRNGVLIASFTTTYFNDLYANGHTEYTVIAVDANDAFGIASETIDIRLKTVHLVTKDGLIINANNRWNSRIEGSKTVETRYEANEYLGASVPEHSFAKMRTKKYMFAFDDKNSIAESLLGRILYYADTFGNGDWVVPVSLSRSDQWYGNETVLEMELTNGFEEIEYE